MNLNERRNTLKQQKAALKQSDIAFGSKLKSSYDEQMEELKQLEQMNRNIAQNQNFTKPKTGERPKSLQEKVMI